MMSWSHCSEQCTCKSDTTESSLNLNGSKEAEMLPVSRTLKIGRARCLSAAGQNVLGTVLRKVVSSTAATVLLQLLLSSTVLHAYVGPLQEQHTTMLSVSGVSGETTLLPCPLSPRAARDAPKLVLWYRTGDKTPIYSHDSRSKPLQQVLDTGGDLSKTHSSTRTDATSNDEQSVQLTLSQHSATLKLRRTTLSTAGLYECRVDFFRSPSHTSFVNLTVIEPPTRLDVLDDSGLEPRRGRLGPYREGDPVIVTCTAYGGNPSPSVVWIRNGGDTLNDNYEESPGMVKNRLTIPNVSREWQNSTLTCLASNSDVVAPMTRTFVLDLLLLPTTVTVTGPSLVNAGSVAVFRCVSDGSEPPVQLTWMLRGKPVDGENSHYGGATSSVLHVNMTAADDGREVVCKAANPALPGLHIQNSTSTVVHYPPLVRANLGRQLTLDSIKEGDDVYFSCDARANPPVTKVVWYHQGVEQTQNVTSGVILSGNALVLQKVGKHRSGSYHCLVINSIAQSASLPVYLKIKYLPECQSRAVTYFIYSQPINVTCTFTAHPHVTEILWHWNTSSDVNNSKPVERLQQIVSIPTSGEDEYVSYAQLTVYPIMSTDDRELTCSGVNELGNQTKTCKFFIKRANMPAPLSSCRLANITASSLSLTCEHPNLPTAGTIVYRAQVYLANGTLFANLTSPLPNFNVSHLDQGTNYQIKVYVSQGPITSQPVLVSASTSLDGLREIINNHVAPSPAGISLLAILIGIIAPVFLVLLVFILKHKLCVTEHSGSVVSDPARSGLYENKLEVGHAPRSRGDSFGYRTDSSERECLAGADTSASLEDINPDVVPSREETIDLLPDPRPLDLSCYVRYPVSEMQDVSPRISPPVNSEEFHPMLADCLYGEESGVAMLAVEDGRSELRPEAAGARFHHVGVTIGGMGQTVTSVFRSRSRTNNIASFLNQGNKDHETIV